MYGVDDLVLFVKVAESGNFASTAKILKVSYQAVARRLRNLEDRLGVTLIYATTREFKLTAAGERLFEVLRNQTDAVDSMLRNTEEFAKDQHEPQGTIKVALPASISLNLISPKLPLFLNKYPKINLTIRYLNFNIDLVRDGYDLAILNHIPSQQHLKIKKVFTTSGRFYCSQEYAKKYGIPKTPEELINHIVTGAMYADGSIPAKVEFTHIGTGESVIVDMPRRIISDNELHNVKFLQSNEVICAVLEGVHPELNAEGVVKVLPEYQFFRRDFYLVIHPHANDLKVKLFSQFLESCFKK